MKYIVVETVLYRVEAESEEHAIDHVINDKDRSTHCFLGIDERTAYEDTEA